MANDHKVGDTVTLQGTIRGVASDGHYTVELGDPSDKEARYRPTVQVHKSQFQAEKKTAKAQ